MAEEIRVTRDDEHSGAVHTHASEIESHAKVEAIIPAHPDHSITGSAPVHDPDIARDAIEQTRSRMSETIDEIEDVLLARKDQIQEKLDVFSPVRERPLPSAGIALGAGLLLGLLTGGGSEHHEPRRVRHDEDEDEDEREEYWRERAETWESRARRLRAVAREQEERLEDVQESWGEQRARSIDEHGDYADYDDADREADNGGIVNEIRTAVTTGITGFLSRAVSDLVGGHSSAPGDRGP